MFKALFNLLAPIFIPIKAVDAAPKPKTIGIILEEALKVFYGKIVFYPGSSC